MHLLFIKKIARLVSKLFDILIFLFFVSRGYEVLCVSIIISSLNV